jgi:hypothetical protein
MSTRPSIGRVFTSAAAILLAVRVLTGLLWCMRALIVVAETPAAFAKSADDHARARKFSMIF